MAAYSPSANELGMGIVYLRVGAGSGLLSEPGPDPFLVKNGVAWFDPQTRGVSEKAVHLRLEGLAIRRI